MTKNKNFTPYNIFHIHRIMSVLLESEFPSNDHKEDGKSNHGTYLATDREGKIRWIIGSLAELGIISVEESHLIEEYLTGKYDVDSMAMKTICKRYGITKKKLEDLIMGLKI